MTADAFALLAAAVRRELATRGFPPATLVPDADTQTLYLALGDERWWQREVSAEDLAGDSAAYAARVVADWMRAE